MLHQVALVFVAIWDQAVFIFGYIWWLIAAMILMPLFVSSWLFWRRDTYKHRLRYVTLEIKIPREIKRSIKAMEQVFTAIHNLKNLAGDFQELYVDGEITRPYHLELVSFGGDIHFYIRAYFKQKNLVEAAFGSFYTDVELVEVDDYLDRIPSSIKELYGQNYDMYGAEVVLARPPMYPIRSYMEFESPAEEKEYDPISVFIEVLSKVKKEEFFGYQIIITPKVHWSLEYNQEADKLKESKIKVDPNVPIPQFRFRSPGEEDTLKAVENNLSKPCFETTVRLLYLSPRNLFYDSFARRAVTSTFNQYGSHSLNSFKINYNTATLAKVWHFPYVFPKIRNNYRKARLLYNYRHREFMPHEFMGKLITSTFWNWNDKSPHHLQMYLSTESLATIFHPPTVYVLTAPHVERLESRKAGPPAGLAIFGEEEDIQKFE